jgi:hypothetical protein
MKKKDIITLVVATVIIVVSVYFSLSLLFPKTTVKEVKTTEDEITVPEKIDDNTYRTVSTLSDYGKPNLDGLGKENLFAGF